MPIEPESVIEYVHLVQRPRRLVIDIDDHRPGDTLRAAAGRIHLGTSRVSDRIEIDLPPDLPIGRVAISLKFSNIEETVVSHVSMATSLVQGHAILHPDAIEQSGWSAVEVVHHLGPGARFKAVFHPPTSAEPDQRFSVMVENENHPPVEVYSWDPNSMPSDSGPVLVDAPLGTGGGPTRILLVAEGKGAAGRWVNTNVVEEQKPSVQTLEPVIGEPPRLIVLYVMDALRADHVGYLGHTPGLTPTLDRMASEGATFLNHFAVAPNTPPSTRALFSGLCLLDDRQLPHPGPIRMAEVFRAAGYRTASITGNPHLSDSLDLGTGFDSVELLRIREDHHPDHPPTVNRSAEILHEAALRWIDTLEPTERGFLYIHSMNPHNPYSPPPEIEDRLAPARASTVDGRTRTLVAIRDRELRVDDGDQERIRELYAACVAYNDREMGLLLDELDARIAPQEIAFVVTSDHGEELFEHGGVLHGYTLQDEMLRIPLVVRWPGRVRPVAIGSLTNTLDLHASLVKLVDDRPDQSSGRVLWPEMLRGTHPSSPSNVTYAAAPGLDGAVMIRSHHRKLIFAPRNGPRRGQGHGLGRSWDLEYVFDLENDPGELHNLAGTPDLEVALLRARLMAWTDTQRTLQPVPGGQVMNAETKDQLEALGYIVEP